MGRRLSIVTYRGRSLPRPYNFEPISGEAENPADCLAFRAAEAAWEQTQAEIGAAEELATDERLSEKGVAEKLAERYEKSLKAVEPARYVLKQQREKLQEVEKSLTPWEPLAPDDAVSALRYREIRDTIRAMPSEARFELLSKAQSEKDVDTLRAVADAPPVLTGVTERYHALLRKELVAIRHPGKLEEAESIRRNIKGLEKTIDCCESILAEAAGKPFDRGSIVDPTYVPGPVTRSAVTA